MNQPPYKEDFEEGDLAGFLSAVMTAARSDRQVVDSRLVFQAISGLGSDVPAEGGFLISPQLTETLWEKAYTTGAILSRCARQPMSRDRLTLPTVDETARSQGNRAGGIEFFWTEEGESPSATKPKFGSTTFTARKLLALLYSTNELAADAPAMAAWLARVFGTEAAFVIEQKLIQSEGTGSPLGVLHSPALITTMPESGQQAGSSVLPSNLAAMDARLWPASHRTAIWCMGNEAYAQINTASFSDGQPVVRHGADGPTILSKPLVLTEATPALGAVGDVLLFDPAQYIVAERENEFVNSIHVRFLHDENIWRFRMRLDGQPAPPWRAPIVPANGTTTCSPYVALGAR